jgi:hypothetical protein
MTHRRLLLLACSMTVAAATILVSGVPLTTSDHTPRDVAPVPWSLAAVAADDLTPAAPVRPRVTPTAAPPRHRTTTHHHHRARATHRLRAATSPRLRPTVVHSTAQQRMERAVARIPGYWPGAATWQLTAARGHWAMTDWYNAVVYISTAVPASRIYDVVTHEWGHLVSVRAYDSVGQAKDAMNAYFGGTGLASAERAADCIARRLGARWTSYTSCADARWQQGASRLLAGRRL